MLSRLPPVARAAIAPYTGFLHNAYQIITVNQAITLSQALLKSGIVPSDHQAGGLVFYNFAGMHMGESEGGLELWPALPGVVGAQC